MRRVFTKQFKNEVLDRIKRVRVNCGGLNERTN